MVSTQLKNIISQIGNLPQVGVKIKKYLKPPPGWDKNQMSIIQFCESWVVSACFRILWPGFFPSQSTSPVFFFYPKDLCQILYMSSELGGSKIWNYLGKIVVGLFSNPFHQLSDQLLPPFKTFGDPRVLRATKKPQDFWNFQAIIFFFGGFKNKTVQAKRH